MRLELKNGRQLDVPFKEGQRSDFAPGFVISIRKSGSTMLTKATELIAGKKGIGFLDVGSMFFYANIPANVMHQDPEVTKIIKPGVMYAGFRDYPSILERSDEFRNGKKFFFVRDPRDALVSEYFSNAYSHDIPSSDHSDASTSKMMSQLRQDALTANLEEYVLRRASAFVDTASMFLVPMKDPSVKIMKYEDIIFDKPRLIGELSSFFSIELDKETVSSIAKEIDLRPASENPSAFVRRVTPGDHAEKLAPATIRQLNAKLRPIMDGFGYGCD